MKRPEPEETNQTIQRPGEKKERGGCLLRSKQKNKKLKQISTIKRKARSLLHFSSPPVWRSSP
jgi:hypothetical protein